MLSEMKSQRVLPTGQIIARNSLINFASQVVPWTVAIFTVPIIIRGLGPEKFGLFSIAFVVLGYLTILDFGLGRATTKYVAESIGASNIRRIPEIVWTSLLTQFALGVLGFLVVFLGSPILARQLLNIATPLQDEAIAVFRIAAVFVPIAIITASLSGILEASQRFDLVNAVKIPSSVLTFAVPAIGLWFGFGLIGIMFLLLFLRVLSLIFFFVVCIRAQPIIITNFNVDLDLIAPLLVFGGWVTISNILIPLLVYLDRFLLGSIGTMAEVGYYSLAYDTLSRLQIFPSSLVMTLFPAFSAIGSQQQLLKSLFAKCMKYLLLGMGPIILIIVLFSEPILVAWLGEDIASRTTTVFQILTVGFFINAFAQIPASLLDGIGRPDLRARIFFAYLMPYLALLWVCVHMWGVVGAAVAWTLRAGAELIIFQAVVAKLIHLRIQHLRERGFFRTLAIYTIFALLLVTAGQVFRQNIMLWLAVSFMLLFLFVALVWKKALDEAERKALVDIIKGFLVARSTQVESQSVNGS
jgi:O-antigen/teichoic acid export membrane protein